MLLDETSSLNTSQDHVIVNKSVSPNRQLNSTLPLVPSITFRRAEIDERSPEQVQMDEESKRRKDTIMTLIRACRRIERDN